ncbi:MAG: YjbF family lipoprotein [Pseudomonadota bacterium]
MKRSALLAVLLALAGCGSSGTSDYSQFYQALRQSAAASFGNGHITKDQAAAIPYASMGYRVNGGPEQLVVLATDANGEQLWTSKAGIVIVTRGGRIVRTVGLANNVSAMTPGTGLQFPSPADAAKGNITYMRSEDFPDFPTYGLPVTCTSFPRSVQTIVILGQAISTLRIDDKCHSAEKNWSFTDSYWIDPDSRLAWRTIQHISPEGPTVETKILRPPG